MNLYSLVSTNKENPTVILKLYTTDLVPLTEPDWKTVSSGGTHDYYCYPEVEASHIFTLPLPAGSPFEGTAALPGGVFHHARKEQVISVTTWLIY